VPLQVMSKERQSAPGVDVQLIDDALKKSGQQVFSAKGKRRGDSADRAFANHSEGRLHEVANRRIDVRRLERRLDGRALSQSIDETVDCRRRGSALGHRAAVHLEMADETSRLIVIAFFGQHDFIDEPATEVIRGGNPRDVDTREQSLQGLEQAHEIPNGEDVVLHEDMQRLEAVDRTIDRMIEQGRLERDESLMKSIEVRHVWPLDLESAPDLIENTRRKTTVRVTTELAKSSLLDRRYGRLYFGFTHFWLGFGRLAGAAFWLAFASC
jgi:hypothetical protein